MIDLCKLKGLLAQGFRPVLQACGFAVLFAETCALSALSLIYPSPSVNDFYRQHFLIETND